MLILLTLAASSVHHDLEALARGYFTTWNTHDTAALGELFADDASLRDWETSAEGKDAVVKANGKIFTAVPNIRIEVLTIHVANETRTAACEIIVHLPKLSPLKVVDIISFRKGKIQAVRAYKG